MTPSILDRVARRIADTNDCWIWPGAKNSGGYGVIQVDGFPRYVHRMVWTETVGPIPDDMQIDHLCRNRSCCNPDHLEVVDARTNNLRGESPSAVNARRTHCVHGHKLTGENLMIRANGNRECRACRKEISRRYEAIRVRSRKQS